MSRFVVMGVSGCGKSHIGRDFAVAIGAHFIDGDSLHPPANIEKMSHGDPLDDGDRAPWLDKVGAALIPADTVVACSSLKRKYRDQIRTVCGSSVTFLFLRGKHETLMERMSSRPGHFMPATLLENQMATLEPPCDDERHLVADIEQTPKEIVAIFQAGLQDLTV